MSKQAFISYSREDSEFAHKLHRRLTSDGVRCFLDEEIGWGDNWVEEIEKALNECDALVLVLTPAFLSSRWTKIERTSAMAGRKESYPLLRSPCTLPALLEPIKCIDVTTDEKFEEAYPCMRDALGGPPRANVM